MKNKNRIIIILISIFLTCLFICFPAPHERMLNIQNYLITVGGIISAIVIAYLSAKIFNVKTDRESRQKEINKLGERLTAFRKILFFVMNSNDFWVKYHDITTFKKKYPELTYERLRNNEEDELSQKFWLEENEISKSTISLYMAMEEIYEQKGDNHLIPYVYNKALSFKYSLEDLRRFHEPTNQIWYYLDGRFAKYGKGLFNDTGLYVLLQDNFREELPIADIKLKGKDFSRLLLAELGVEFYEYVIPKMAELIKENTGIPRGLLKTFYSLLAIMLFGVIFPIILQSINVPNSLDTFLTLCFVNLTVISLLYFLLEFYNLIYEELHPNADDQ